MMDWIMDKPRGEHMDLGLFHKSIILLFGFLANFCVIGMLFSLGIFFIPLEEEFNVGRSAVSWMPSIATFVEFFLSFGIGLLIDKFGFRIVVGIGCVAYVSGLIIMSFATHISVLYIGSGIYGASIMLIYLPCVSCAGQWFEKNRGLSIGTIVAGGGAGNFALPPLLTLIIENYGWRIALQMASLLVVVGPLPLVFTVTRKYATKKDLEILILLRTAKIKILYTFAFLIGFAYMTPFLNMVPYAEYRGFSPLQSSLVLTVMGAASIAGRVVQGIVADKITACWTLIIGYIFMSISSILWPFTVNYYLLLCVAAVFGYFAGAQWTLAPQVVFEYWETTDVSVVAGLMFTSMSVGNLLGPPFTGWTIDYFDSYKVAGAFCGGIFLLCAQLFFMMPSPKKALGHDETSILLDEE
eukprot:NODE_755_length_1365_cov_486.484802_g570_i0.p1 GENE.NODE_755_length_1365_cov_486.484802_g570_i0~~NODE_755_length_1365_cov_486.484802_g570_i0.p1  ORF type:complete len:411 (-),score=-32.77 NODE_755_length_1365_cov_486.484802_g570_i0:34-1266(-)